jgi:hypothetical protein
LAHAILPNVVVVAVGCCGVAPWSQAIDPTDPASQLDECLALIPSLGRFSEEFLVKVSSPHTATVCCGFDFVLETEENVNELSFGHSRRTFILLQGFRQL